MVSLAVARLDCSELKSGSRWVLLNRFRNSSGAFAAVKFAGMQIFAGEFAVAAQS